MPKCGNPVEECSILGNPDGKIHKTMPGKMSNS